MLAADSLLAGILHGGKEAFWRVAGDLSAEDFASPLQSRIYQAMRVVAESDAELDWITVAEEVERGGVNAAEVLSLNNSSGSPKNVEVFARSVRDDAISRRVKAICANGARSGDLTEVQAGLGALVGEQKGSLVSAKQALRDMWAGIDERYGRGEELTGISTGIPLLDEWTGGFQRGRLYGIGARAKMGKTILTMNIASHMARHGSHVAVWSLEMSNAELMERMTSAIAGVPTMAIQRPKLMDSIDGAFARMKVATNDLMRAPLFISDRMDVTVEQIEAQARQLHAKGELDVLVVDHLGLVQLPKADRHDIAVGHVTRRLKKIAKELGIVVILVIQLNRANENGAIRPPRASDARDSGNIEQDVDAFLLLHRPRYYDKGAQEGLRLDLNIARNGQTGLIYMRDETHMSRFTGGTTEWEDAGNASGNDFDAL